MGSTRISGRLACWVVEFLATIVMTISGTFRCPRPLNRGVRLIKVSFEVNKGNKFGDFADSPQYRVST